MLTMNLLTVLAGTCCFVTCAIALVPSGPSYQQTVIDGPSTFPETNLDDIEYQIHFKEEDTHPNLSCQPPTAFLRSKTNAHTEIDDTVHLKLQKNDPLEFFWIERPVGELQNGEIIRNYRKTGKHSEYHSKSVNSSEFISLGNLLFLPHSHTESVYSICKTQLANTSIIGMVSWESESPSCQVVSNGQLMNLSNYFVLTNYYLLDFIWLNVTTWRDIPRAADLFHAQLMYPRNGIDTEKRYIGRLLSPDLEPIIIDVPKGKEEMPLPPRYSEEGAAVQRQVLVPVGLTNYTLESSLLCKPATGAFNSSQYREEVLLDARVPPGGGGEKEQKLEATIGEATVFRKIDEKVTLNWEFSHNEKVSENPVIAGKDSFGYEFFVCRLRCVSWRCPTYNYTSANGSVLQRSMDKVLGTFSSFQGTCANSLNNRTYSHFYDWLANPTQAKVSWTPVTSLSTSNGTVVTSDANGETYAIGRMSRLGTKDPLGHVDLSSKTILLSNGNIYNWENGQEKVDILMLHE